MTWFCIKRKMCYLSGSLDNEHLGVLVDFLSRLKKNSTAYIYINSEGGDVDIGFAMYDVIQCFKRGGGTAVAVGIGCIQSIAVLPFLACDERNVGKNASFVVHSGTVTVDEAQPQRELKNYATFLNKQDDDYVKIISNRTKLTHNQALKMVRQGEHFGVKKAVKTGFVTRVF